MTADDYARLRRLYRGSSELARPLVDEFRAAAGRLRRFGGLPATVAPEGVWNEQAEDDLCQSWIEERLLRDGEIQALLDRASTLSAFRALLDRSIRQHTLNSRARSQSQNLYKRLAGLLEGDGDFRTFARMTRPADSWWGLSRWASPSPHQGSEQAVLAALWGVGAVAPVRYRPDSRYLSPVVSSSDLKRLVCGVFELIDATLTLSAIARAMARRFDLDDPRPESLEETTEPLPAPVEQDAVLLQQAAIAVITALSMRQCDIVLASERPETLDQIAARLGCSVGTIVNEQRRIRETVLTFSDDDVEARALLRAVADLLYEVHDE